MMRGRRILYAQPGRSRQDLLSNSTGAGPLPTIAAIMAEGRYSIIVSADELDWLIDLVVGQLVSPRDRASCAPTPDALTAETRAQLRALVQRLVETGYPRPARARTTAWP